MVNLVTNCQSEELYIELIKTCKNQLLHQLAFDNLVLMISYQRENLSKISEGTALELFVVLAETLYKNSDHHNRRNALNISSYLRKQMGDKSFLSFVDKIF